MKNLNKHLIKQHNTFLFSDSKNHKNLLFNDDYDEPTYLTVRVDFFPDIKNKVNDIENFSSYRENSMSSISYNDMPNPLFDYNGNYSTYNYLLNSGEIDRAEILKNLIKGFTDLTWNCPYYITSVEGLNDIISVDPKRGLRVKHDGKITLKCIEGLDMRINALLNMYKKIAWDDVYQRWILPDMMRYFKMNIYISEFRVFHNYSKRNSGTTSGDIYSLIDSAINELVPTICFECTMCEFDISDIFSNLSSLNISDPKQNQTTNEIKIHVGNISENTQYGLFIGDQRIKLSDKTLPIKNINKHASTDITYNDRTGLILNHLYEINHLDEEEELDADPVVITNEENVSKSSSFLSRTLETTAKTAKSWAENKVDQYVDNMTNKKLFKGLSINDALNALKSENIFAMFNMIKTKVTAVKNLYPEVSAATNGKLDTILFKDILKNISASTATDPEYSVLKEMAEQLLQYGNNNNLSTMKQYEDALAELINDVEISKATSK